MNNVNNGTTTITNDALDTEAPNSKKSVCMKSVYILYIITY